MSKLHPFWKLKPPAVACPLGEQVINGGFSSGDFTGWDIGDGEYTPTISPYYQTYPWSARWDAPPPLFLEWKNGKTLSQSWDPPIPVLCLTECYVWFAVYGPYYTRSYLKILYSDGTSLTKYYTHESGWYMIDILALMDPTKSVSSIGFWPAFFLQGEYFHIDTFSMVSHQP